MNILITGHTGFVGTNLIRAFRSSYTLYGLDIAQENDQPLLPPENTFSWSQLNDLPSTNTVIHLAGKAHDTANASDPEAYFEVNLGLTQRIFDNFLQSDSKTFIFFSSVKAVADTLEGETLTEDHKPDPKTPYGQSKLAAEQYILDQMEARIQRNHQQVSSGKPNDKLLNDRKQGKRVFILRPVMIHGPGNKGNLNLLYKIVQKGIPWPLGAFENQRSFLSIDNLIYILNQIMMHPIEPGIYNVADDQPLSTNELVHLMAESLKRKPRIWSLPPSLIKTLARSGDILRLPLNSERLKKLTESYVASNQKIKKALGINELPINATTGVRQTLKSF